MLHLTQQEKSLDIPEEGIFGLLPKITALMVLDSSTLWLLYSHRLQFRNCESSSIHCWAMCENYTQPLSQFDDTCIGPAASGLIKSLTKSQHETVSESSFKSCVRVGSSLILKEIEMLSRRV